MGLVRYFLALLLLLIPCISFSADIDCDNTTLQAAINAASDGGTITCKAGAFTWTASPTIPDTKGLTITGKGKTTESGTVITHAGKPLIIFTKAANSSTDISGFRFVKSATGNSIILFNNDNPPNYNADPAFRIHGNYFDDDKFTGHSLFINGYLYGLIDGNDFIDFGNCGVAVSYGAGGSLSALDGDIGAWAWSQAQSIGTNKAVYIENNYFSTTATSANDGINAWNGSKYIARYNTVNNTNFVTHSGCTGGRYQPIWTELYKNEISVAYNYGQAWLRSSSGVIWNNKFPLSPNWNTPVKIDHERSYMTNCSTTYLEVNRPCNGTQTFDENTAEMTGWRCLGQPGYGPIQTTIGETTTYGMDMGYVFAGVFAWGNVRGPANAATNLVLNGTDATQALHLGFGRELFNAANMTVGGSKPATCSYDVDTGRDIYIDTTDPNNPVIWQCSATNTWTQHWTPYTCPHPLAGAGECGATAGTGGYTLTGASAPVLVSAALAADGVSLSLLFSRATTATINTGVTVTPSSGSATAAYASGSTTATLVYTLSRAISSTANGGSLLVSYTQPGDGLEATDDGQDVLTFTNTPVINNSTQGNTLKTVTPSAGAGCGISPDTATTVVSGLTTIFYTDANQNYYVSAVGGTCGGSGTATYTTDAITADCTVTATCTKISPDATLGAGAAVTFTGAVGTLY